MDIKKNDKVLITKGKDKGKSGKVSRILEKESKIIVEGLNVVKKTIKPRKEGEKGQIISIPSPLSISNIKFICPSCNKASKIGHRSEDKKNKRYCKSCKTTV